MATQRIKKTIDMAVLEPFRDLPPQGIAEAPRKRGKPPKPRNCRSYALKRFAARLPGIVETMIDKAEEGSVAHLKALIQLTGLDKAEPEEDDGDKSLEQILNEQWAKEKPQYDPWLMWLAEQRAPRPEPACSSNG